MVTKPTKPTAPTPRPTRADAPTAFSAAADAGVTYQWTTLPDYIEDAVDFTEEKADQTLAAAVAGNIAEIDLSASAGNLFGVNSDGDALETVELLELPQATQGEAEAGTATGVYMDPLRTKQAAAVQVPALMNASGSAPMYACRAWVDFNGTGTVAIRASGNVSSITDLGTGSYQVNLTTAISDTNYAIVVSGHLTGTGTDRHAIPDSAGKAVGSFRIKSGSSGSNSSIDFDYIYAAIFR